MLAPPVCVNGVSILRIVTAEQFRRRLRYQSYLCTVCS